MSFAEIMTPCAEIIAKAIGGVVVTNEHYDTCRIVDADQSARGRAFIVYFEPSNGFLPDVKIKYWSQRYGTIILPITLDSMTNYPEAVAKSALDVFDALTERKSEKENCERHQLAYNKNLRYRIEHQRRALMYSKPEYLDWWPLVATSPEFDQEVVMSMGEK